jgi:hypothetical protein
MRYDQHPTLSHYVNQKLSSRLKQMETMNQMMMKPAITVDSHDVVELQVALGFSS